MSDLSGSSNSDIGAQLAFFHGDSRFRRSVSRWRFVAVIQIVEYLAFFILGLYWFRAVTDSGGEAGLLWRSHVSASIVIAATGAAIVHCVFQSFGLYDLTVLTQAARSAVLALCASVLSFLPFAAPLLIRSTTSDDASFAGAIIVAGVSALALSRVCIAWIAQRWRHSGAICRRIYIIADSERNVADLQRRLLDSPENRIVGYCHLPPHVESVDEGLKGALEDLRSDPVDVAIVKLSTLEPDRLARAVRLLRHVPRQLMLAPDVHGVEDIFRTPRMGRTNGFDWSTGLGLIKLSDRPLAGWRWIAKDAQDRLIALLLLLAVSPVMIAIAIGIKLSDPGPIFFRQIRRGYGNNTFEMLKFRSMRVMPAQPGSTDLQLTARNDPRIFPFGRILRKTSLDELPQLFNVLMGDMWIVGPRPHSPYARAAGTLYVKAVEDYVARYRIKPGITGWAQVCGWRGPTETLEHLSRRVEHDLFYIENWSILFDAKILLRTLTCAFGHENAF